MAASGLSGARVAGQPVATILLAAGLSHRFGGNKLLHDLDGRPMVRRVAETLVAAMAPGDEIIVVLGHEAAAVQAALHGLPLRFVLNDRYEQGMGLSLAAGVAAIDAHTAGAMIALGDMPWIEAAHIKALRRAFDAAPPDAIIVPTFAGRRGHPVIFSRRWFPDLLDLHGDRGARAVLVKAGDAVIEVAMANDHVLRDLDRPDDA